jgi:hypothetical protein
MFFSQKIVATKEDNASLVDNPEKESCLLRYAIFNPINLMLVIEVLGSGSSFINARALPQWLLGE